MSRRHTFKRVGHAENHPQAVRGSMSFHDWDHMEIGDSFRDTKEVLFIILGTNNSAPGPYAVKGQYPLNTQTKHLTPWYLIEVYSSRVPKFSEPFKTLLEQSIKFQENLEGVSGTMDTLINELDAIDHRIESLSVREFKIRIERCNALQNTIFRSLRHGLKSRRGLADQYDKVIDALNQES